MQSRIDGFTLLLFAACAVVGVLAATGQFNSIMNFPVIFGGICFVLGSVSAWRGRSRGSWLPRVALLLVGVSIAVGGWAYQKGAIRDRLVALQEEVFRSLGGRPAPALVGLDPLDTEPEALQAAAAFSDRVTIVTFWATWCSPCWTELAELPELYEAHRDRGLNVLAITQYEPEANDEQRQEDRAAALAFLQRRGLEFPAAITAEQENYRAFQVRSIPSTALVDGEGTIVAYAVGLDGSRTLMARAVELLPNASAAGG